MSAAAAAFVAYLALEGLPERTYVPAIGRELVALAEPGAFARHLLKSPDSLTGSQRRELGSALRLEVAYVQNGREVTWAEVTTEDLRATICNYRGTEDAARALIEWRRRFGRDADPTPSIYGGAQ